MTESTDWTPVLTGELLLLGLLGKIIYTEPEQTWLEPIFAEDIFSETPLGADEAETVRGLELINAWVKANPLNAAVMDDLKADYTALFLGPGKMLAPLWESVYFSEERLVFQERTLEVRQWYRRFGLESEHLYREPDDHIGLELFFMTRLAGLALQAVEEQDEAAFKTALEAQKEFYRSHLLQWGPTWANLVVDNARTDFYKGLGHLTLGSLQAVARALQLEMPEQVTK